MDEYYEKVQIIDKELGQKIGKAGLICKRLLKYDQDAIIDQADLVKFCLSFSFCCRCFFGNLCGKTRILLTK
jgi:hypothetical protein